MSVTFNDQDHPRGDGGKFTTKLHEEQDLILDPSWRSREDVEDLKKKVTYLTGVHELTDDDLDYMLSHNGNVPLSNEEDLYQVKDPSDRDGTRFAAEVMANTANAFQSWVPSGKHRLHLEGFDDANHYSEDGVTVVTDLGYGMTLSGMRQSSDDVMTTDMGRQLTVRDESRRILWNLLGDYGTQRMIAEQRGANRTFGMAQARIDRGGMYRLSAIPTDDPDRRMDFNREVFKLSFPSAPVPERPVYDNDLYTWTSHAENDEHAARGDGHIGRSETRAAAFSRMVRLGGHDGAIGSAGFAFPRIDRDRLDSELGQWDDLSEEQRAAMMHRLAVVNEVA